ncbi:MULTISPECIES: peptidoglycan-binding domain-containing protein [unclassified Lysobacter]|uniref:peptidoglycan-binding domain-containing protein n=1 Tax=unclassified Lysobacter TaxID=2635362 RepID=UPI001BEB177C|nr:MULTISPECIES: peptidoglycan-binding domain-containing protein [unclassified Lysobacter]MBT2748387.1 peptidoglycan-binding protein [Lysobacter sp. ISL-42]MBT2749846.1 peptidoglycan-binding protein [Lysobacter sp. ISL-50]MBT2781174.1 peptidoglycan-binding protein [Lysobacter sp. ISL-52]
MTDALTANEAIALLRGSPGDYATPEKLRALAAQVDADSPGRLTVLYSGQTANGVWSSDVIDSMVDANEDVRVINKSEAARLFKSRDFYHAVAKAYGLDDAEPLVTGKYRGPASDWLYHPTEGPWADASARFADKTIGEVRAIVSDAQPNRVFGAIEVPHVLANKSVTTVEEIPRDVLVARQSTHGEQAAFEMIVARARENVGRLRVVVDDVGMPQRIDGGAIQLDSRAYFIGTQIEGKVPGFTAVTRPLAETMNPPTEYALAGQRHITDWQAQLAQSAGAREAAQSASIRRIGAAVGLGVAASAYDAVQSGSRVDTLLAQDNPLAAQSELTHYAARGTGGWIGGASAGLVATAASTGPGVIGFIVIGGAAVAGAHVGEHVATVADSYKTFIQKDTQGVIWHSNGLQWVRKDMGDLIDDGKNEPVKQDFSADPEKADELNYRASISATELAIGKLQSPKNPYSQPASDNDSVSQRRADWERNPQTGTWDRKVVEGFEQPGVPMIRPERASAERAAELDRASQQVIQENIANGPAPMAARFQLVHRSEGWERFGVVPPSIQTALQDDSLIASDGKLYQRTAEGQWQRNGESVVAAGNLRQELDSTRAALQPQLTQHQEQVAAIPPRQPPTLEDIERKDLMKTLRDHKVEPSAEQLEAALEAVRRTQQEHGINPLTTSLHLRLNTASGKFDIDSPIEHIGRDADGANRVQATTSPLEVQLAMLDLRSPPPTTPEPPELRIANLSPQQQAALEQVVREANRLGLQRDDVQATARQAVADATDGIPDIVTTPVDADRPRSTLKPEASRQVDAPSPVIAKVTVAEPVAEKPQDKQPEQNPSEAGRTPTGTLDGAQQTATAAPLAAATTPPLREAENVRTVAEPGLPPAPKPAEPAPIAVAPAEPVKPDVVVAKPPELQAPASQPAPDAPTTAPHQPAPHVALVAAEATLTPDSPTQTPPQPVPQVTPVAAEAEPAPDDGTLRYGDRGDDVEMLQYRLQRVGYGGTDDAPLQRNGQFDAATEQAVRQLQRDHGLAETGSVDPETVHALAVAQQAKIESQKADKTAIEAPQADKAMKPADLATVVSDERAVEAAMTSLTSPLAESRLIETNHRVEPAAAPNEDRLKEREPNYAPVRDKATPAPAMDAQDLARMSPADQAMFAKIRAAAPGHVSDETVAAAMLSAKRDKIHDADSIAQVGVANGKLWVGSTTPGFYGAASLSEPPPAMQDTLRETQAVNQQREQQLAQEASQRNPDDPSRGPSR